MTREPVYAALYALVATAAPFATIGRRLKHWTDCPAQPALYMTQKREEIAPSASGTPSKWLLDVSLYIYALTPDDGSDTAPAQALNPLLDAVVAAIAPPNQITNKQTLGGLVEHCWIEGAIETDEGALGDQSVAIVPIRILAF